VADGLNVVAVGVAHESAVVLGVVLGPHTRLVEHLGTGGHGGVEEGANRCPIRGGDCDVGFAEPAPESIVPSQKSGFGGTPYPIATSKSMSRLAPKGASTAS